ncbi:RDD family protein [Neorhodopirellula lusitana]|uniref:RDD family protein n=1 Tax=Neorhodopirellula lusitana TaxID=445327 RepID=UPI00384ED3F7
MKLKCPGCAKLLQIPESAIGKVVKCSCGKQLRVPVPKGAGAAPAGGRPAAPQQAAASRATQPSRPSQTPRSASQARPSQPSASPLGVDAGMFDELTETDLAPVAVVPQPGVRPAGGGGAAPNPYASTMTDAPASGAKLGPLASQNKRFANYFLDGIFTYMISFAIGMVFAIVMIGQNNGEPLSPDQEANMNLLASGLGMLSFAIYYCLMEAFCGATLAKFITGTRVVAEDGSKAGFGKILGRSLARMIPFDPLSFLFGDTRLGWHDTLSGTRVVDIRNG